MRGTTISPFLKAALLVASGLFMAACSSRQASPPPTEGQAQAADASPSTSAEHSNHNPRHGGVFFMALNYEHHLEGTLTAPGVFRLYLYDARLQPLAPAEVKQAKGTLHWGDLPEGPGMPFVVGQDGQTLQVRLDKKPNFPLSLTALVELPGGKSADEKPELFTFTFDKYTNESPAANQSARPTDPP